MSTMGGFPRAVHELEERFGRLEGRIPEGPEKEAISVLHGIVMEVWRSLERDRMPADGVSIADVADLWKGTPPMEGEALNQPCPWAPRLGLRPPGRLGRARPPRRLPGPDGGARVLPARLELRLQPAARPLRAGAGGVPPARRAAARDLGGQHLQPRRLGRGAGHLVPPAGRLRPQGEIARRYGVWREPDGFSERALYVVDPGGRIADARVSPRLHRNPDIYELLDAVEAAGRREAVSA